MAKDGSSENHLKQKIGHRIRTIRHLRGLTQEQLAESANLSVEFISVLERGRSWASVRSIIAIADALRIPYWMVFGPNSLEPSINQLLALFPTLLMNGKTISSILVVSHISEFREGLKDFLREYTFIREVAIAVSIDQALFEVRNYSYDALIIDLRIDDLRQSALVNTLKAHSKPSQVILVSAPHIPHEVLNFHRENGFTLIEKDAVVDLLIPLLVTAGASQRQIR
jgi:transcriptional regulator with XRE-family HTH domain